MTDMTNGPAIWVFDPFKIVNVTLPSLIVPAALLTVAESDDPFARVSLNVALAPETATVVAAAEHGRVDSCRWTS